MVRYISVLLSEVVRVFGFSSPIAILFVTTPTKSLTTVIYISHTFHYGQRQRPRSKSRRSTAEARKAESSQEKFVLRLRHALFHLFHFLLQRLLTSPSSHRQSSRSSPTDRTLRLSQPPPPRIDHLRPPRPQRKPRRKTLSQRSATA